MVFSQKMSYFGQKSLSSSCFEFLLDCRKVLLYNVKQRPLLLRLFSKYAYICKNLQNDFFYGKNVRSYETVSSSSSRELFLTKWAFSYRSPSMRISYASYANCSLPAYGDELSEVLHDATNLHPQNGVIVLGGISNGVGGLSTRYGL